MAHFGLAELLQNEGDTVDAIGEYEAGLATRDDWLPALTRLAWFYALGGDGPLHHRAFVLAQRAVDLTGGHDLGSLDALAAADASMGRWRDAVDAAHGGAGPDGSARHAGRRRRTLPPPLEALPAGPAPHALKIGKAGGPSRP